MGLKNSYRLIIFFVIFLFLPSCVGIQIFPLREGESIQLEFSGPVEVSYFILEDTEITEISYIVEDQGELVLANLYDDGDDGTFSLAERFYTYFRLNPEGGSIHLGMDPQLKKLTSDELEFPDPLIRDQYHVTSQFHLLGTTGGALVPRESIDLVGDFIGGKALRWKTLCVDPLGVTVFEVDFHRVQICNDPNTIMTTDEIQVVEYTREEIAAMIADNHRSMLQAVAGPAQEDRLPLAIKIVNVDFDPAVEGDGDPGTLVPGDTEIAPTGGCQLRQTHPNKLPAGIFLFLIAGFLVLFRQCKGRDTRPRPLAKRP